MPASLFNQRTGIVAGGRIEADAGQEAQLARLEDLRLDRASASVPRGAADFLTIAHKFDTAFFDAIPLIEKARRDEATRFIMLIDALYDWRVKLIMSAEAEPAELYLGQADVLHSSCGEPHRGYLGLLHGLLTLTGSGNQGCSVEA